MLMDSRKQKIAKILLMMVMSLTLTFSAFAEPANTEPNEPSNIAPGIELSTQYPSITAKGGDHLSFDLDVANNSGKSQDIALSLESVPDSWDASFSAGSKQVSMVHVKQDESDDGVDFTVDVPKDAENGEYPIVLVATCDGYESKASLTVNVNAEQVGESSFVVDYPQQEGDSGTSFTFSSTLTNNTLTEQNYSFSTNAPEGWNVSFVPSGETTKVAAITIDSKAGKGINISVEPPKSIVAGEYTIGVAAVSATDKMDLELSVTITGSYSLDMTTPSGLLSVDARHGKETPVTFTLTNTGNKALSNVNLSSQVPSGWNVRFASETIETIDAGQSVETVAYITPGDEAIAGDYVTILTAKNNSISDTLELRVTVKTETTWGLIGIAVILVLVLIMIRIVRKYGRR